MKKILIIMFTIAALIMSSCTTINPGLEVIPPTVEEFLQKNGRDFNSYEISDVSADYEFTEQSYEVCEDIESVWQYYMKTDPVLAFNNRIIDFGVVYNPEDSEVYTSADIPVPCFCEGQIYILDLEIMGIYNIPVAFKVTRLDPEKKMIEFIYLKDNLSNGYQQIYLSSDYNSKGLSVTHIKHVSFFRSEYEFRDKYLYPPFHKQITQGFHENIFKLHNVDWEQS